MLDRKQLTETIKHCIHDLQEHHHDSVDTVATAVVDIVLKELSLKEENEKASKTYFRIKKGIHHPLESIAIPRKTVLSLEEWLLKDIDPSNYPEWFELVVQEINWVHDEDVWDDNDADDDDDED